MPHRFGGTAFRLGRRELGHLHGDDIADLPLPRPLRDELIASGRARAHRWRPDSGWVTIPLATEQAALHGFFASHLPLGGRHITANFDTGSTSKK